MPGRPLGPGIGAPAREAADDSRLDRAGLTRLLDTGIGLLGAELDAALDAEARARLIELVALLSRWNRAYNLTAVRAPADMVPRHLLDSLAVLPWVQRGPVLDAGTGAGLPGLPLAIARPDLAFTLLDSNGKKTRFVRQAVLSLGLANVDVVQSRLEAYRPAARFGTIVARAVASLAALHGTCARLAAADARLLALKGRLPQQELTAPGLPHRQLVLHRLSVPLLEGERHLIEIPLDSSAHG